MKIILLLLLFPATAFCQAVKERVYKKGDVFKYQLTSESYNNGNLNAKSVSVSEHTVVADSGFLAEEIKWLSKKLYTTKDTTSQDDIAKKVKPYRISLVPGDHMKMPPLTVPEMTGEITDLNTFYVAIAPALHAQKLSKKLPYFKDSVVRGKFADGVMII